MDWLKKVSKIAGLIAAALAAVAAALANGRE
jgi:hypothetical protein